MQYIKNGGHLVLGQRSVMKDIDNSLWPQRQPGPLSDLLGGRVEQYYALVDAVPIEGKWGSGDSPLWAELLSAKESDVEVLMRYGKSNGWLDGQPAAITRKAGKGRITYVGAWLDPKTMAAAALWMTEVSGVKPALGAVPEGVEVLPRYGGKSAVFVLVNFAETPQAIKLPAAMQDVLNGGMTQAVTLPHYGVAVVAARQ
jgi:beta-galactosidase